MIFEYTGRHIEVTPALKTHAEQLFGKLGHLFNGNESNTTRAHIILEVERGKHRAEVIVNWRNEVLTAAATQDDMYLSISQTIDRIEKQALKLKEKVIDKSHRAEKASTIVQKETEVQAAPSEPRIINDARYPVKPMTAEEASMHLEHEDNSFLVFRNAESERISVIFKRNDGNYGLIEP